MTHLVEKEKEGIFSYDLFLSARKPFSEAPQENSPRISWRELCHMSIPKLITINENETIKIALELSGFIPVTEDNGSLPWVLWECPQDGSKEERDVGP